MANDGVANVRFNVAKTLSVVGPKLATSAMQAQVKPALLKLNEDSDFDVRYYASEAATGEFLNIISSNIQFQIMQSRNNYLNAYRICS